eukprot:6152671-Pleurochrysis_carterae.AAC.2
MNGARCLGRRQESSNYSWAIAVRPTAEASITLPWLQSAGGLRSPTRSPRVCPLATCPARPHRVPPPPPSPIASTRAALVSIDAHGPPARVSRRHVARQQPASSARAHGSASPACAVPGTVAGARPCAACGRSPARHTPLPHVGGGLCHACAACVIAVPAVACSSPECTQRRGWVVCGRPLPPAPGHAALSQPEWPVGPGAERSDGHCPPPTARPRGRPSTAVSPPPPPWARAHSSPPASPAASRSTAQHSSRMSMMRARSPAARASASTSGSCAGWLSLSASTLDSSGTATASQCGVSPRARRTSTRI